VVQWIDGRPPRAVPLCGFHGEKCLPLPGWPLVYLGQGSFRGGNVRERRSYCESGLGTLYCSIMHIQSQHFPGEDTLNLPAEGVTPSSLPHRPHHARRCSDPDTNFRLARQRFLVPVLRNEHGFNRYRVTLTSL